MNRLSVAVQAALAALVVAGCASPGTGGGGYAGYGSIKPVQRVSGGGSADAWYQLGRYQQGQERLAEAELAFRRVLQIDAGHAEAHNALGAVLAGRGQLAAAETEFRVAVQSAPKAAHIHGNLGRILLLQGKTDEAILVLEEGLRLDQNNRTVRTNLVAALEAAGIAEPLQRATAHAAAESTLAQPSSPPVAAQASASGGVVVLPTVPVADSRSAVKVIEPTRPPVVASASALSYQDVRTQGGVTVVATRTQDSGVQVVAPQPVTATSAPATPTSVVAAPIAELPMAAASVVAEPAAAVPVAAVPVAAVPVAAVPVAVAPVAVAPVVAAPAAAAPVAAAPVAAAPVAIASVAPTPVVAEPVAMAPAAAPMVAAEPKIVPASIAGKAEEPAPTAIPVVASVEPQPVAVLPRNPGQPLATQLSGRFRLEVSNGNGVEGMARRVRGTLSDRGFGRIRITNEKPYRATVTVVQYREGFEPQASSLARRFPLSTKVVHRVVLDPRADVRVVLGRDLPRSFALNEADLEAPAMLAAAGTQ